MATGQGSKTKVFDTIHTATFEYVKDHLFDQITKDDVLLAMIAGSHLDLTNALPKPDMPPMPTRTGAIGSREGIWTADGGEDFLVPIRTNVKSGQFIGVNDEVDVSQSDPITMVAGSWKTFESTASYNEIRALRNAGSKQKVFDYIDQIRESCRVGAATSFGDELNGAASETSVGITGIQSLISMAPSTGTRLGLDLSSADNSYFRNQATDHGNETITYVGVEALWYDCTIGARHPEFGIASKANFMTIKRQTMTTERNIRQMDEKIGLLGFQHFMFQGQAPILLSHQAPTSQFRWVTREAIKLVVNSRVKFTLGDWLSKPETPQIKSATAFLDCEVVNIEPRITGVLFNIAV